MKPALHLAVAAAALIFASIPTSTVAEPASAAAAGEPGLVGTWRLVRFENRSKDGKVDKPYGDQPRGYFVYGPTGHLNIQIMRNPPLPPYASGDADTATDAEKLQAIKAYVAYFGTYRVDKAKQVLHLRSRERSTRPIPIRCSCGRIG